SARRPTGCRSRAPRLVARTGAAARCGPPPGRARHRSGDRRRTACFALAIAVDCRIVQPTPRTVNRGPSGSSPAERRLVLSGIALPLASYLLFSLHDATVKWLVATLSTPQILFVRSAMILALCLLVGGRDVIARAARSPVRGQLALRALVMLVAWLSYYTAARSLGLAELVTLY